MIRTDSELSVRRQCELLGVTRSAIYYEPKQPDPEEVDRKEQIMARLDNWHTTMPFLGTRKLVSQLRDDGYAVGRKPIRSCMREMGIHAVYPKANLSKHNFKEAIVPYLLRNKVVSFPNQVWSIDITYIKMHHGHMYLTAIIDWFSRKTVGWTLSDTLDTQPVLETVQKAAKNCGIPAILNSDQGSQFISDDYKQLLKSLHIRQSMDGKSRWADHIMIERWFRSLKTEFIYINEFCTPKELRRGIAGCIDTYNNIRPHAALDNATPEEVYSACFQPSATPSAGLDRVPLAC